MKGVFFWLTLIGLIAALCLAAGAPARAGRRATVRRAAYPAPPPRRPPGQSG